MVYLNYIFECDCLIELSNNKLPNDKLSDNNLASELVENGTFSNQSQARKFDFYDYKCYRALVAIKRSILPLLAATCAFQFHEVYFFIIPSETKSVKRSSDFSRFLTSFVMSLSPQSELKPSLPTVFHSTLCFIILSHFYNILRNFSFVPFYIANSCSFLLNMFLEEALKNYTSTHYSLTLYKLRVNSSPNGTQYNSFVFYIFSSFSLVLFDRNISSCFKHSK